MEDPSVLLPFTYFNETVLQFLDDLKRVFPNDRFLPIVAAGIRLYVTRKPFTLQDGFSKAFGEYVDRVERRDEEFFLQHTAAEYKQDYKRAKSSAEIDEEIRRIKAEIKQEGGSVFARVVDYLKTNWRTMDAANKEVIWQYMGQLVKLHRICEEKKRVTRP